MINIKEFNLIDAGVVKCELCRNHTPAMWCEECEENECQYCLEAYGCERL